MTISRVEHVQRWKTDTDFVNPIPEPVETPSWIRNPSWLDMPVIAEGEERIQYLAAVDPGGSHLGFSIYQEANNIAGNFIRVDWGDGNIEIRSHETNNWQSFLHEYDHSNPLLDDTDRPATITSSVITRNNHGYPDGYKLFLNDISGPTNIYDYKEYHVVNSTTNTFQISETAGGSPITIDADGTLNLLPYKQAIVTITVSGPYIQGWAQYPYSTVHGSYALFSGGTNVQYAYDRNFLQIDISCPWLRSINGFRGTTQIQSYSHPARLEVFNGYDLGMVGTLNWILAKCKNLKAVPVFNVPSSCYQMQGTFAYCHELEILPDNLNLENIQNGYWMFSDCRKLKKVPHLDLPNASYLDYMFYRCYSLENISISCPTATHVPGFFQECFNLKSVDIDVAPVVAFNMFQNCQSLTNIPNGLDFSNILMANSMFFECRCLPESIKIYAPALNSAQSMFQSAYSLKELNIYCPNLQFARQMFYQCNTLRRLEMEATSILDINQMFYECRALMDLIVDTTQWRPNNATSAFYRCTSLKELPLFDASEITLAGSMFSQCQNISVVPAYNFASLVQATSMFAACYKLEKINATFDFSNASRVDSLFSGCRTLKELPFAVMNLPKAENINNLFYQMYCLKRVPKVILGNGICTSAQNTFRECRLLEYIPKIENFGSVTHISHLFYFCRSLKEIPDIDFSGVTSLASTNTFYYLWNLVKFNGSGLGAAGMDSSINLVYGRMSADSINDFFTNTLADISGQSSVTINMSNYPAISSADVSIATNKGWTVTV